jgi:nucleotide-binding universal stress UspA family protein
VIEFEHVPWLIDFSDASIRAVSYATALAIWYEAQLGVRRVVPWWCTPASDRN